VFNTAVSMVQDTGIAEDISQEVFVTVFKSVHSFNENASLSTWLYRITVNKCLDHLRSRSRQKRSGLLNLFSGESSPAENKPAFEHPGIQLEQKEKARYLFEAIQTLPENQKTAFVLSQIEELSQKEVADIMNLSIKAVESLIQRAKGNLRNKLGHIYDRRKTEKGTSK
jgi:RNA polymerase sigma factor (sigma-70 family)